MPLLKTETHDDILFLTLDDPKRRNAFGPSMVEEFYSAIQAPQILGVFVTASGSSFCSGGDLPFYKNMKTKSEGLASHQRISEVLQYFYNLPIPKACYVQGPCYGGGVELLSCFDFVVAHPASLFGLWQRRLGLTCGWGGHERLAQRMGVSPVTRWLRSAQTLSVFEARAMGLVDQIALHKPGSQLCAQWIKDISSLGTENWVTIHKNLDNQSVAFQELWFEGRHKQFLKKLK